MNGIEVTPYSYTITDLSSLPSVTVRDADLTVEKSYDASALDLTGLNPGDNVLLVTDEAGQPVLVSKLPESGGQAPDQGGMEGGMSGMGGMSGAMGGMSGGSSAGGSASQEESYQLYSLEEVSIASVTSQEHMSLEIQVDELDISRISLGQVLCVPVAALGKEGGQDVVYTGCDEDSGSLMDPVAVTTGVSDGEYVQLLSGLEEGGEVYYAWYDGGSSSDMPDMEPPFER